MADSIISIIIPCYNHGQYINDAINSIKESHNDNYDIIIINDGSTDNYTNNKLEELKSDGYNVVSQNNQGLGKSRNNGIKISKGKYILPLDADNKIKPDFITKAIDILETNPSVSIVYSDRQLFGNSNNLIKVGEFDLSHILAGNYIDACAIYRRAVWESIGGYDEKMPVQGWEDWDFWLSAIERKIQFCYIPEPLFLYRVVDNSMIQELEGNPNKNALIEYIYKKHISLFIKQYNIINNELSFRIARSNYDNKHLLRASFKYLGKFLIQLIKSSHN
jgi:glycosyltransferase involved in cell wall biosynthesis